MSVAHPLRNKITRYGIIRSLSSDHLTYLDPAAQRLARLCLLTVCPKRNVSYKRVSRRELPVFDARLALRPSAAERFYDIRCRIVHAKAESDADGPLLPTDPGAQYLGHDIDLVRYLAGKALRMSRRPLRS
jgi:hypothetical protein